MSLSYEYLIKVKFLQQSRREGKYVVKTLRFFLKFEVNMGALIHLRNRTRKLVLHLAT